MLWSEILTPKDDGVGGGEPSGRDEVAREEPQEWDQCPDNRDPREPPTPWRHTVHVSGSQTFSLQEKQILLILSCPICNFFFYYCSPNGLKQVTGTEKWGYCCNKYLKMRKQLRKRKGSGWKRFARQTRTAIFLSGQSQVTVMRAWKEGRRAAEKASTLLQNTPAVANGSCSKFGRWRPV